jgi:hypothetical protein
MPKGILVVESRPSSPEREAEYHAWYTETHLREVVGVDGFVSARRFAPVGEDGPSVAIYEIEADDLQAVVKALGEAVGRGDVEMSDVVQLDPLPSMRLLEETASYDPAADVS